MATSLEATSGSDIRLRMTWIMENGDPLDLTYATVTPIEATGAIADRIAASVLDGPAGEFEVFIEGSDPLALGSYNFRVQVSQDGGDSVATPAIGLKIV